MSFGRDLRKYKQKIYNREFLYETTILMLKNYCSYATNSENHYALNRGSKLAYASI